MPTATKSSKKTKAVEEDEEEDEAPKKSTKKKVTGKAVPAKKKTAEAKNGKVAKKKKAAGPAISARDVVLKVLVTGAPKTEVKARARKLAEEEGAEVSFKTFDVSYFIKYMTEKKGYTLEEKKKAGTVKLIPPVAEKKKKATK